MEYRVRPRSGCVSQTTHMGGPCRMATVTKKDLVDRVADATGLKRVEVKQVTQALLDNIIVELGKGNRLEFRDFGVFEVRQRAPRKAQNPKTLDPVKVPAKRTVKFKAGNMMKQAINTEAAELDFSDQAADSDDADTREADDAPTAAPPAAPDDRPTESAPDPSAPSMGTQPDNRTDMPDPPGPDQAGPGQARSPWR